jgi:formylglycine-generating enzyme required for sulfatase activity
VGLNITSLDSHSIVEHGLRFRYVPGGPFLMGSEGGDPDEQPVHEVHVDDYWLSETTISWFDYTRLMGWDAPPVGLPRESELRQLDQDVLFRLGQSNIIRLQYCEDKTLRAGAWHIHQPNLVRGKSGAPANGPDRQDETPYSYSQKPMIAVSWEEAEELCAKLSTTTVRYRLPTEAEWEKAARGGLVGERYAWGDELPTDERCDFDRFEAFAIKPCRAFPPNEYGLYAMCGSVWEWTTDEYDALSYSNAPTPRELAPGPKPSASEPGRDLDERERVLRGGSWADGPDAVTVSFRMSRWGLGSRKGRHLAPNIGFRICRVRV